MRKVKQKIPLKSNNFVVAAEGFEPTTKGL